MIEALTLEMVFKIILATFLGLMLGAEREHRHKSAGLRTYTLVAVGSALFTIMSLNVLEGAENSAYDPGRIASQIVVGIGFLGAGLIIQRENRIEGLTTAAGLWTTAAVSMAVGFGFYFLAIFSTFLILGVLIVVGFLKDKK